MNRSERTHYWQQQIETWDRSSLSGAAFCKRSALSYNQFAYWRRKLQEPDEAAASESSPGFVRVRQMTRSVTLARRARVPVRPVTRSSKQPKRMT